MNDVHSIYFVGIGGASMSALAAICADEGKRVLGCDRSPGEYTDGLTARGIEVSFADDDAGLDGCDLIVYTDAAGRGERHLARAAALNKTIVSRGAFLAMLCGRCESVVAVAGCHGKTTCTGMLAHIFARSDRAFTAHIGGRDKTFGNSVCRGRDYFITEACEYNKNFLLLKPTVGVVLNTAADHLECYGGERELAEAYKNFAGRSSRCVSIFGDECVRGDVTFGTEEGADYRARSISCSGGRYSFEVFEYERYLCSVSLKVLGRHNIANALAAVAAARACGLRARSVEEGLASFSGIARRFESIGRYRGCEVIADYAHHPDEIAASLRTARSVCRGRLYVIFQPHTYSRTRLLFDGFAEVLSGVDDLLIYKTFAAREYFDAAGSAVALSRAVKKSRYADDERDIERFLQGVGTDDKILVLGAGDIYFTVRRMTD